MAKTTRRDEQTGDIIFLNEEDKPKVAPKGHNDNIVLHMQDADIMSIGTVLTEELAHDEMGRGDWEKLAKRYTEALGMGPESEPDDVMYEFSDTSDHPLLLKSLTNFQAKALAGLMPNPSTVVTAKSDVDLNHIEDPRTRKETAKKVAEAVQRVQDFYNWYLLEQIPSYVEDTDQILNDCGLLGLGVRRIGVDTSYKRTPVRPIYVALEDLIFSYDAKNMRGTGRLTHRYKLSTTDLLRGMLNGTYRTVDVVGGMDFTSNAVTETRDKMFGIRKSVLSAMGDHKVYDIFTYLFLADDPHPEMLARPYIVTIHGTTQEVLAIRRNWAENDPDEEPMEHFAGYVYSPGRNAVTTVGLGALLTNMTMALRKAQRRALDAAYLANHPSGFINGSVSIRDDSTPFTPGELRPIDAATGKIQDAILLNPFKGPDSGLIALYDRMNDSGKELGNIASVDFAQMMKSGVAAGPALAAYDESTEFQTSVHRRLYRGHQTELRLIHEHMRNVFGGQQVRYGTNKVLEPEDLYIVTILPAMKPGHVSRQRELMESQMVLELAEKHPDVMVKREAVTRFLRALGTQDIEGVMLPDPSENPTKPADPVTEYLKLMRGEPITAGVTQNHRAHIDAHVAQMVGLQSSNLPVEMGQKMMAQIAAHIAEHEGLDLATKVAQIMGIPVQALMEGLPPEIEAQIAPQMAQAIAMVEAERKPKDDVDPRITIEQIRSETKIAVEKMKDAREEAERAADAEIARMREAHETYRNTTDNLYAIEIAEMKLDGKPAVRPAVPKPPGYNPKPVIGQQIIDP